MQEPEITVLIPCLNEAETIGACIGRARQLIEENGLRAEILVSDNGSTDGSREIAAGLGARVVQCPVRGYGAALQYGIEQARGEHVLMGDGDDSYHFDEALPLLRRLREGADVCVGSRLRGAIEPGAMPWLNRRLGNPVLSAIGRRLYRIELSDFHCGMRAFDRKKVLGLGLLSTGMEWATEMIIKARFAGLALSEVPITLHRDGRSRPPHLRPWRDGWRHLRFMLLHSPRWLFFVPGAALVAVGLLGGAALLPGELRLGAARLDVHTLLVMAALLTAGVQLLFIGVFAKLSGHLLGVIPFDPAFDRIVRRFTLEKLLAAAMVAGLLGATGFGSLLVEWSARGFSGLDYRHSLRRLIPALTLLALSFQGVFNGFMLSILFLRARTPARPPLEDES